MKQIYADSIQKAKSYYDGVQDIIHDLSHTDRVFENAKDIAKSLGYKDIDFLEVCVYWHDVARTQGIEPHEEAGAAMARDDLLARGASQDDAKRAYEAIRFHKSTANPITIEGKIVRDADKLEIFTVGRWQACADAGWNKEYSDDLKKTIENIGKYPDAFSYNYTKQQFAERLPKFQAFYESVKNDLPE
jgi:HD superfamily phosphohydrolase YqeK